MTDTEDTGLRHGEFLVEHARAVTRDDYVAFTSALGFGGEDAGTAPHPVDLLDPLNDALHAAQAHDACPAWCEDCDQWERSRSCVPCRGSGCGPGTASGAYEPCDHCAGDGRTHQPYTPSGTWRGKPLHAESTDSAVQGP